LTTQKVVLTPGAIFPDSIFFTPKNFDKVKPEHVVAGGATRVWWRCAQNKKHEWESDIHNRTQSGRGCPFCSHARVSDENSLADQFPYIAAQLHPAKNGDLTGKEIAAQSKKKIWWVCKKGPDQEWQATPANRTGRGSGCPACDGKQISATNCLSTLFPATAKLWDKTEN
jgi:hypothetical protein